MSKPTKAHQLEYEFPSTVRKFSFGDYAVARLFSALVAVWLWLLVAALIESLVPERAEALNASLLIADAALMFAVGVYIFRAMTRGPKTGD